MTSVVRSKILISAEPGTIWLNVRESQTLNGKMSVDLKPIDLN